MNLQESIRKDLKLFEMYDPYQEYIDIAKRNKLTNYLDVVEMLQQQGLSDEEVNAVADYIMQTLEIDESGVVEANEADTFTYDRDGVPTEHEVSERDKHIMSALAQLREMNDNFANSQVSLKSHGSAGNSMEMLYDDLLQELDRHVRYFLEVPGLDGISVDNSHPHLG